MFVAEHKLSLSSRTVIIIVVFVSSSVSSRTDLYDDVVDVTPLSA